MILGNLDRRWISAASRDLCDRLGEIIDSKLDREIKHILAWVSFFPGEVDLSSFISQQIGKRQVYLPRVEGERQMTFLSIDHNWASGIQRGFQGIPTPSTSDSLQAYDPRTADETVIIVPGLAFDKEGSRLGRGKGYYSNFLRPPVSSAVKIGACWSLQVLPELLPSESDPMIMDWICNEREALNTGILFDDDVTI